MLIACPHCATAYEVEPATLGGAGRNVRCARCHETWFAVAAEPAMQTGEAAAGQEWDAEPASESAPAEEEVADPGFSATDDGWAVAETAEPEAADRIEGDDATVPGEDIPSDAPSIVPDYSRSFEDSAFPITGGDIEAFAARRRRARAEREKRRLRIPKPRWPMAPLPTLILVLVAATAIILGWRADVVRILPQTASFYERIGLAVNLRGLVFEGLKTSREMHEGIPVMVVEGEIVSVSRRVVEVPRLRFGVRNTSGQEIYNWTAMPARSLASPGERIAFRSRLASPPEKAHDVAVRFFSRHDAVSVLR